MITVFYFVNAVFLWRLERTVSKSVIDVVNASKQVKKQKELLEEAKKRKSLLRYAFWPITLFK